MEVDAFFAEHWPTLRPRLSRALAAAGVPAADRDDILQETALRLYQHRARLDPDRAVDAYARVVALNVWRSLCRQRADREVLSEAVPERPDPDADTERAGLARIELNQVSRLLSELGPEQRGALLGGIATGLVDQPAHQPVPARVRMARMRARRHLAACLQRIAAWIAATTLVIREMSRLGWGQPTSTTAGGAVAVALVVATFPASSPHSAPPGPAPRPPISDIAAPLDKIRVNPVTNAPTRNEAAGVTSGRSGGEAATPGRNTRAAEGGAREPRRPPATFVAGPAEVGVLLEAVTNVDGNEHGARVYHRGHDRAPACVIGVEPATQVGMACTSNPT